MLNLRAASRLDAGPAGLLPATIAGLTLGGALALGSWTAMNGGPHGALVLGAIAAGGCLALLLARAQLGLALLAAAAFLLPFEFAVSADVAVNPVMLLLPALFALWLARGLAGRHPAVIHRRTFVALGIFMLLATFAWFYGSANWNTLFPRPPQLFAIQAGQWAIYCLCGLAFFLAAQVGRQGIRWLTAAFLGLGVLALIGRYGGPLGDLVSTVLPDTAVASGTFFVWLTALALGQALFNARLARRWRAALFLLALAVPVLGFWQNTQWASSWLPPLLVFGLLFWLRSRLGGAAAVVLVLLVVLLSADIILQSYDWQVEREVSVGGRLNLWRSVLELGIREPLLGLGLTNYHHYHRFIPLLTEHGAWFAPRVNSHNVYIDLFAQMGLAGLTIFFWLIAEIAALAFSLRRRLTAGFEMAYVNAALAGLAVMLLASVMVEWLLPFIYNVGFPGMRMAVFSWLFLGGLVALGRPRPVDLSAFDSDPPVPPLPAGTEN
ncbi:MAG: O-antigen ligase family protein [Candidatus Promineifilaceae bacterium]